jgi:hypothetical protein
MPPRIPEFAEPRTRTEIVAALASLHEQSTQFWRSFDDLAFFAPLGDAWSPADNVRHLDRSIKPLTQVLRLPVPIVWLVFGPARAPSRGFIAVREAYRAELAKGLTAGRYAPPPAAAPDDPTETRRGLMMRRDLRARSLVAAISDWDERDLDRCRLPHPAPGLGKLTVREMLFFTLYHNLHHVVNVAKRLQGN